MKRYAFCASTPVLVTLVLCAAGAAPACAGPMFRGLGFLSGLSESSAAAVSADGSVVVGTAAYRTITQAELPYGFIAPNLYQAFRWTQASGMVGLGFPAGMNDGRAVAVSADGSVVVGSCEGLTESGKTGQQAFRWTAAGGIVGCGVDSTYGAAVTADGSVVFGNRVYSSFPVTENPPGPWPFRWTEGSGTTEFLGCAFVTGVSADGSVKAGVSASFFYQGAVRWSPTGGITSLAHLRSQTSASANAVSADGAVIVGTESDNRTGPSGWSEAFCWTEAGGVVGLGYLPGGLEQTQAFAVSADGSVIVGRGSVGYAPPGDSLSQAFYEAFIWTPDEGMRNLRDLLVAECGLDLTGWTLASATGVSADGRTIVGTGVDPEGNTEAWMAVIPEPATLSLLACGGAAMVGRRRRRGGRPRQ
jgi:uncharacterized membrane protein